MPGYSGLEVCLRLKEAEETEYSGVADGGQTGAFQAGRSARAGADAHIVTFEARLLSAIARLEELAAASPVGARGAARWIWRGAVSRRQGSGRQGGEQFGSDTFVEEPAGNSPSKKKKKKKTEETAICGSGELPISGRGSARGTLERARDETTAGTGTGCRIADNSRDITPEELTLLSALAAKLDGKRAPLLKKLGRGDETRGAKRHEKPRRKRRRKRSPELQGKTRFRGR